MERYGSNSDRICVGIPGSEGFPMVYFKSPTEDWISHRHSGKQPTGKYIKELLKAIGEGIRNGWEATKSECREAYERRKKESKDILLESVGLGWLTHGETRMTSEQKEKVLNYMKSRFDS